MLSVARGGCCSHHSHGYLLLILFPYIFRTTCRSPFSPPLTRPAPLRSDVTSRRAPLRSPTDNVPPPTLVSPWNSNVFLVQAGVSGGEPGEEDSCHVTSSIGRKQVRARQYASPARGPLGPSPQQRPSKDSLSQGRTPGSHVEPQAGHTSQLYQPRRPQPGIHCPPRILVLPLLP